MYMQWHTTCSTASALTRKPRDEVLWFKLQHNFYIKILNKCCAYNSTTLLSILQVQEFRKVLEGNVLT
jgi:hypothetical protein